VVSHRSEGASGMPEPVPQYVIDGASDLARALQDVRVVPLRKERPAPADRAIHSAGNPHLESLHPARQRDAVVSVKPLPPDQPNQTSRLLTLRVKRGRRPPPPRSSSAPRTPAAPAATVSAPTPRASPASAAPSSRR